VSYRKQARKPTVALWALVAMADVVLVFASVGTALLIGLASAAVVAVAGVGAWRHLRPPVTPATAPVPVSARRS